MGTPLSLSQEFSAPALLLVSLALALTLNAKAASRLLAESPDDLGTRQAPMSSTRLAGAIALTLMRVLLASNDVVVGRLGLSIGSGKTFHVVLTLSSSVNTS